MKKVLLALAAGAQVYLLAPLSALAANTYTGLGGATNSLSAVGSKVGGGTDLPTLVGNFINVILGLLGIVFVVLIVYAGFEYLTSMGEPAKVDKAKKLITNAVIGLVIIVAAYAISSYVIGALVTATSNT